MLQHAGVWLVVSAVVALVGVAAHVGPRVEEPAVGWACPGHDRQARVLERHGDAESTSAYGKTPARCSA